MSKLSQRQVVAKVVAHRDGNGVATEPFDWDTGLTADGLQRQYFAQVTGGSVQASVQKVYDGGSTFPEVLPAPIEVGDLTVTRHFDPDSDGAQIEYYRQRVGKARFDVNVYTLDADHQPIGKTRLYPNALLVNLTDPDGDASGGGPATFSLTFAISTVTTASASN